ITAMLDEADGLGLMGRAAVGSAARRFHPLLRTYLEHQLELETDADERQAMHLRIAADAEEDDWLTAANHYIRGGRPDEAMRVIEDSATSAFGNGDFGGVSALLARMPEIRRPL